ncbi:hypothetical protein MY5147_008329 [Beauveria neobassiana]
MQYGVDYDSSYQLALDMDSAPGLTDVVRLRLLRMILVWAHGVNYNTTFCLCGLWRWNGASVLLASRAFWETITRRPIVFGDFCRALTSSPG